MVELQSGGGVRKQLATAGELIHVAVVGWYQVGLDLPGEQLPLDFT